MKPVLSSEDASALRHELRTCLNQVGGYCGLARDEFDGPIGPELAAPFETVQRCGEEMLRFLGEFIPGGCDVDLTRLRDLAAAGQESGREIAAACDALRHLAARTGPEDVSIDLDRIEQAIGRWSDRLEEVIEGIEGSC